MTHISTPHSIIIRPFSFLFELLSKKWTIVCVSCRVVCLFGVLFHCQFGCGTRNTGLPSLKNVTDRWISLFHSFLHFFFFFIIVVFSSIRFFLVEEKSEIKKMKNNITLSAGCSNQRYDVYMYHLFNLYQIVWFVTMKNMFFFFQKSSLQPRSKNGRKIFKNLLRCYMNIEYFIDS